MLMYWSEANTLHVRNSVLTTLQPFSLRKMRINPPAIGFSKNISGSLLIDCWVQNKRLITRKKGRNLRKGVREELGNKDTFAS